MGLPFVFVNSDFQPLDILFFHKNENAFEAHIAIYIGNNQVIHLAKYLVKPIIWTIEEFLEFEKYQVLIGGKRFRKKDNFI